MIIAVTSQNFRNITGHAGKARRFIIYNANNADEIIEIDRLELPIEMLLHTHNDSHHPIDVADTLITSDCNKFFVEKMARRKIKVLKTCEKDPLQAILLVINGEELPRPEPRSKPDVKSKSLYKKKHKPKK
jgi:predicted Fe-Mo cluster-binding NifX family protein